MKDKTLEEIRTETISFFKKRIVKSWEKQIREDINRHKETRETLPLHSIADVLFSMAEAGVIQGIAEENFNLILTGSAMWLIQKNR